MGVGWTCGRQARQQKVKELFRIGSEASRRVWRSGRRPGHSSLIHGDVERSYRTKLGIDGEPDRHGVKQRRGRRPGTAQPLKIERGQSIAELRTGTEQQRSFVFIER